MFLNDFFFDTLQIIRRWKAFVVKQFTFWWEGRFPGIVLIFRLLDYFVYPIYYHTLLLFFSIFFSIFFFIFFLIGCKKLAFDIIKYVEDTVIRLVKIFLKIFIYIQYAITISLVVIIIISSCYLLFVTYDSLILAYTKAMLYNTQWYATPSQLSEFGVPAPEKYYRHLYNHHGGFGVPITLLESIFPVSDIPTVFKDFWLLVLGVQVSIQFFLSQDSKYYKIVNILETIALVSYVLSYSFLYYDLLAVFLPLAHLLCFLFMFCTILALFISLFILIHPDDVIEQAIFFLNNSDEEYMKTLRYKVKK